MAKSSFKSAKGVLVFDGAGKFVCRAYSLQAAAKIHFVEAQAVSFACSGKYTCAGAYYFRIENENVRIDEEDWGNLRIRDYDKLCGEKRNYHTPKMMTRKYKARAQKMKPAKEEKRKEDDNE